MEFIAFILASIAASGAIPTTAAQHFTGNDDGERDGSDQSDFGIVLVCAGIGFCALIILIRCCYSLSRVPAIGETEPFNVDPPAYVDIPPLYAERNNDSEILPSYETIGDSN